MALAIAPPREIFESMPSASGGRRGRFLLLAACVVATGLSLLVLSDPKGLIVQLLVACAGLAILSIGLVYTTWHREAVVTAILLTEILSANVFIPAGVSTALRYGMNVLFCAPLLPMLWRSGALRRGGFRLLAIYFAWCLITVTYSLTPAYSAGRAFSAMLLIAALTALTVDVVDKPDVMKLLRSYLIGCAIIVGIQVVAAVILPHGITFSSTEMIDANGNPIPGTVDFSSGGISRFVGILTQPNEVGALTVVTIGVALVYWGEASRRNRYLLAGLLVAALALGIAADSRSALGAMAVGGIAFILWKYRWRGVVACFAASAALTFAVAIGVKSASTYVGRGDVSSLTGRTDVWDYSLQQIEESPILGYGYEVEGQIYQLRHFPLWWGPWDDGPRSSLHNNYISHMVGVGIPATLFWLFIILRPWISLFRHKEDPCGLKPVALLVIVPILIVNFAESAAGDCHYSTGVIFALCWALAERARLLAIETAARDREVTLARMSPAFRAIASCGIEAAKG